MIVGFCIFDQRAKDVEAYRKHGNDLQSNIEQAAEWWRGTVEGVVSQIRLPWPRLQDDLHQVLWYCDDLGPCQCSRLLQRLHLSMRSSACLGIKSMSFLHISYYTFLYIHHIIIIIAWEMSCDAVSRQLPPLHRTSWHVSWGWISR